MRAEQERHYVEYVSGHVQRFRHMAYRRRAAGTLATVAVLAAVVALLPWPGWLLGRPGPAAPAPGPALPQELAPYSAHTASVWSHPAGRAVALYESGSSELFTTWQTLVAGADRDTYRTVTLGDDIVPTVLLAPDGGHLLFFHDQVGTDEFTLLDLTTGRSRVLHTVPWQSNVGASLEMLAWSPDGRYLAYAVPAPPPGDGRADSSFFDGRPIQHLAILDLVTDSTTRYPDLGPVWGAAFAPDGSRLAVQLGHELWTVTVDGRRLRPVPLPEGTDLVSGTGWSPDGARIAVTKERHLTFIDAGTGQAAPHTFPDNALLAWRDPTTILTVADDFSGLAEVDIRTGRQRILSRFSTANACEYGLQTCGTYRLQLATGLVGSATIRPSSPDRGPDPDPVGTTTPLLTAVGGLIVVGAYLLVRHLVRRRRAAR
jgi:hypothetical protein